MVISVKASDIIWYGFMAYQPLLVIWCLILFLQINILDIWLVDTFLNELELISFAYS